MKYIQILPVKWTIDKPLATQMQVQLVFDDLATGATFQVQLFDAAGAPVETRNVSCTGADYAGWDGNNDFPLQHVASALQLTIKENHDAND
jgi:hypothetical protein